MTGPSVEVFDYDKAEPIRRRFRPSWFSTLMFCGASAMLGAVGGQILFQDSGPKNGVTNVATEGCDVIDAFGPENVNDEKVTSRTVHSDMLVRVTLWSYQLPEDAIRLDAGMIVDPAVSVNDLLIECLSPPGRPNRDPGIQHVSAQNPLTPLGR